MTTPTSPEPHITSDFDRFHRCPVSGCDWEILNTALRCYNHRGPALPQFQEDSEGAILRVRFMSAEDDPTRDGPDSFTAA